MTPYLVPTYCLLLCLSQPNFMKELSLFTIFSSTPPTCLSLLQFCFLSPAICWDYPWQSQHQRLLYSLNPVVFTLPDLSAGFTTTDQSLLLVLLLFSFWHFTNGSGWLTKSMPAQRLYLLSTFTNTLLSLTHPSGLSPRHPSLFPPDLSARSPVFCLSSNYHRLQLDMLGSFYTPSFSPELYLISRDCCGGKTQGRGLSAPAYHPLCYPAKMYQEFAVLMNTSLKGSECPPSCSSHIEIVFPMFFQTLSKVITGYD